MKIKASLPQCIIDGSLTIVHASIAVFSIVHCYGLIHITHALTSLGYYSKKLHEQLPNHSMSSMVIPYTIISETKMDITSSTLELTAGNLQYITLDQYSGIHYPNS